MNIIIIGAGSIGYSIARILSDQHSVMVVEKDEKRYEYVVSTLDVGALHANGASPHVIQDLLGSDVDLFLAVTESDETNIFACMIAKMARPQVITMARMRELDYTKGDLLSNFLNVDHVISPEYLVAAKMKKTIMLENAIEHDLIPTYGLELAKFQMSHNRQGIASIPLRHLPLPKECKILLIQRCGHTIIPLKDEVLLTGDEIAVIGTARGIADFDRFLGVVKPSRDVLVIGGGIAAQYLVGMLEDEKVSVRLIEKDEARCRELAQRFNHTIIINDNGADPLVLRNENVGMTDVLVCATNHEESDLLACLVGKHLGVSKTITTFSKPEYKEIFQMAGVDAAISYHEVAANVIVKQTVPDHHVLLLEGFQRELIGLEVGHRCRIRGELIGDIDLPERSVIAMVITKEGAVFPEPHVRIMEGDTVILYADRADISILERIFNKPIPVSP